MTKEPELKWAKFLKPQTLTEEDFYKDKILYQCENLVAEITKEYLGAYPEVSVDDAKRFAITLIVEQMLSLQYEHAPQEQAAMSAELFVHLPKLQDFRNDLVSNIKKEYSLWSKIKKTFKIK